MIIPPISDDKYRDYKENEKKRIGQQKCQPYPLHYIKWIYSFIA